MRTLFFLILSAILTPTSSVLASATKTINAVETLQWEVAQLFKKKSFEFPEANGQEVTVGFMINAKNEIVVLDVNGESVGACDFVRKVLSYQKIKYSESKQLTRYSIKIHLVSDPSSN